MDNADHAQRLAELELETVISAARGIAPTETDGSGCCLDCSAPIPEVRRRAVPGCVRCIECAIADERRRAMGRL